MRKHKNRINGSVIINHCFNCWTLSKIKLNFGWLLKCFLILLSCLFHDRSRLLFSQDEIRRETKHWKEHMFTCPSIVQEISVLLLTIFNISLLKKTFIFLKNHSSLHTCVKFLLCFSSAPIVDLSVFLSHFNCWKEMTFNEIEALSMCLLWIPIS